MNVILLLGCLSNDEPTSPMHLWMRWEGCQHMQQWLEFMVHHTPCKVEAKHVPVFIHPWCPIICVLYIQYVFDPLAWLLVQWCINLTHALIHKLTMISIPVWIWMIGAHDTPHTIQGRWWKCLSILPSMMVDPWGAMLPVWMWFPYFVAWAMVYQSHSYTHIWIKRGVNTCMDDWNSWYIIHHLRERMKVLQFSVIYPWQILEVLSG